MGAGIYHRLGDLSPGRGCRPRFRRGTLGSAFVAPLDWRQQNQHAKIYGKKPVPARSAAQLLASAFGASPPSADCAIKGNVNWSGKCIFHKPDGRWYKQITMEARYGDRWFCTATEAIASGCRETRRSRVTAFGWFR